MGLIYNTIGVFIRLMVIRQHLSTQVNTCQRIPAKRCICSGEDLKWGWKRGTMTGGIGGRTSHFCRTINGLCRNEPYSRWISSFLHNLYIQTIKSCTQALYQNSRAVLFGLVWLQFWYKISETHWKHSVIAGIMNVSLKPWICYFE